VVSERKSEWKVCLAINNIFYYPRHEIQNIKMSFKPPLGDRFTFLLISFLLLFQKQHGNAVVVVVMQSEPTTKQFKCIALFEHNIRRFYRFCIQFYWMRFSALKTREILRRETFWNWIKFSMRERERKHAAVSSHLMQRYFEYHTPDECVVKISDPYC
jgi:hypothetical protein